MPSLAFHSLLSHKGLQRLQGLLEHGSGRGLLWGWPLRACIPAVAMLMGLDRQGTGQY